MSFRFKVLIVETLSETFHVPQSGLSQTESGRLPLKTTAANGFTCCVPVPSQVPLVSLSQYKLVRTFAKKNIFYTRRSSVDCLSMNDLGHATPYVYSIVGREMCSQASPSGVLKT